MLEEILEERTNSLKPMTVSEILDNTFRVYGKNLPAILMFSAVVGGVFALIMSYLTQQMMPAMPSSNWLELLENPYAVPEFAPESIEQMLPQIFAFQGLTLLFSLINMIFISPFVQGGIINLTYHDFRGQRLGVQESLTTTFKKFWKLVLTSLSLIPYYIGVGVVMLILVVLLVVPLVLSGVAMSNDPTGGKVAGFILLLFITLALIIIMAILTGLFVVFTYQATAVEENYGFNAIGRSFKLVSKKFWRVLGITLLFYLIVGIIGGVISFIMGITSLVSPNAVIANYVSGFIMTAFISPILYIATTLIFLDVRARVEGV